MEVNLVGATILGVEREDLYKNAFTQFITPDHKNIFHKLTEKAVETGDKQTSEIKMIKNNGDSFYAHLESTIYFDEYKNFGLKIALFDITDRKNPEEKIQWLANVVDSSDDAIITTSLDGNIATWNKGAENVYSYSAREVIGKNISLIAKPQLKDEFKQLIKKIKDGKKVIHYETVRVRKDSKEVCVSIDLSPIFDDSGKLIGISTIARDITRSKKSELDLTESEEKYRAVFNNASDMISLNLIDENGLPGKFIDINEIGIERLGYSREEFLNMTPGDMIANEKLSELPGNAIKLAEKEYFEFETIQKAKDGKIIPAEVNNRIFELKGEKVALAIPGI